MFPLLISLLQIPCSIRASSNSSNDDGRVHCPGPDNATSSCDPPKFFTYHTCCGDANMFCCVRLKIYVVIGIAVIVLLFVAALVAYGARWICRLKRKERQSYSFS